MGYLKEFQTQINSRDFAKFLQLWEEYCTCDVVDVEEVRLLFKLIKESDFVKLFGPHVEAFISLWKTITDEKDRYNILSQIIDLETSNTKELAEYALEAIKTKYPNDKDQHERLRLVGLRTKEQFQSALSNYDLLAHIKKGNFVYHESGWGVGEIMDFSSVREQLSVEFENVSGLKHITYSNAFKTLIPLSAKHFLARRFSDADSFEKEAKENPVEIIKILLRDLGPKTAGEIKDELCELVIPESDWQKWWQNARAKLKKNTEIESPENIKDSFKLRSSAISHELQILESLKKTRNPIETLQTCYAFIRDFATKAKTNEVKQELVSSLTKILQTTDSKALKIQSYFCLDLIQDQKSDAEIKKIILSVEDYVEFIDQIEIVAFKKQLLIVIKAFSNNWPPLYLKLLHHVSQGPLRDYIYKELIASSERTLLEKGLNELLHAPWEEPEFFLWYFNKIMHEKDPTLLFGDKNGQNQFAEGFLNLLYRIENIPLYKDLVKKMYIQLSNKRYALVRELFQDSPIEFVKEFLLLASKCHTLSDTDLKIFRSLADVVHPGLGDEKLKKSMTHSDLLWTTEAGYFKTQERIKHIGTKEMVDIAKEIEIARALGDLRENLEFKSALEKRANLQRDLRNLSEQLASARIISPDDVSNDQVGVGSIVIAEDSKMNAIEFTILGPWEANPEAYVLSSQSKVAQSMMGLKIEETFKFKDEEYRIISLKNIFGN